MVDIDQARALLIRDGDMFKVAHVTTFEGYRKNSRGEDQNVTVKIGDLGGTVDPSLRYHCQAFSDDGKTATGKSGATIREVISSVHWNLVD
jgi:hypothetical protein